MTLNLNCIQTKFYNSTRNLLATSKISLTRTHNCSTALEKIIPELRNNARPTSPKGLAANQPV